MDLELLINNINDAYRGEEDVPAVGTTEYDYWLRVINRKQREWAKDVKQKWASLFEVRSLTPVVTSGTQSYNLPTDFLKPADQLWVNYNTTQRIYFTLKNPQYRARYGNVFISGRNPKKLTFVDTVDTYANILGKTISMPGYFMPVDLASGTDLVSVDDPDWLVYAAASELAFNDITYEDKYIDLNTKANSLYIQMVQTNRTTSPSNPRTVPTNTGRRIGHTPDVHSD
jgi:hypothetical protein